MTVSFKEAYADQWQAGNARERYVRALLELVGYQVDPYGFMAEKPYWMPDRNPDVGKPDYRIWLDDGQSATCDVCFVEVTGTDRLEEPTVWVRPDKVRWAREHPAPRTYLAFVENSKCGQVRWLRMLEVEHWPVIEVNLGKGPEHYHQVPIKSPRFMTTRQFLADLQGRRTEKQES